MSSPMLKTGHAGIMPLDTPAKSERFELRAYRALTLLVRPLAPFILRRRQRRGKEDATRLGERLGRATLARPDGTVIWVHAASVGETSAVLPLIRQLIEKRPEANILLTTGTVTSARFAATRLPPKTRHQYVPLDSPPLVKAFLDHWTPSLAVFTEQEIWPNLVMEAERRRIPMALVNARMSDASFERWQRRPGLAAALFSRFSVVLAQNEGLAQRFQKLGAIKAVAVGNLKIDAPAPAVDAGAFAILDAALGDRPRLVAASTHAGEEVAIAEAHRIIKRELPDLITIIAPRHPERGEAVAAAVAGLGLMVERRAGGALPDARTDVYVADTIGELGTLYALAPVAFIGGSLVAHGGQNPIEAVRHGAAVVSGPFTHNFTDAFEALRKADGAVLLNNASALAPALAELLANPARLAAMQTNATRALASLSGALERTTATLLAFLPDTGGQENLKRAG